MLAQQLELVPTSPSLYIYNISLSRPLSHSFRDDATAVCAKLLAGARGLDMIHGRYELLSMNNELTVVVLGGEEPDERCDALAVLWVVEVVTPPVEGAILLSVVAREGVLVPQARVQRQRRRDDARHVDIG